MKTWLVIYWRTYDPGLVLTGTVLAHTVAGAIVRFAAAQEIEATQITGVLLQP